jgi:hypothetical protein
VTSVGCIYHTCGKYGVPIRRLGSGGISVKLELTNSSCYFRGHLYRSMIVIASEFVAMASTTGTDSSAGSLAMRSWWLRFFLYVGLPKRRGCWYAASGQPCFANINPDRKLLPFCSWRPSLAASLRSAVCNNGGYGAATAPPPPPHQRKGSVNALLRCQ